MRDDLIALAAGAVIFAACDDGGGGNDTSQTATTGDGADDPDTRDLSAIAGQFREATFRGEYNLTGAAAQGDDRHIRLLPPERW
jgi:hypothetical protein